MTALVLASRSPRRRALLEQVGLACVVVPSSYVEQNRGGMPEEEVLRHALGKANDVLSRTPGLGGVVVGADTTVVVDDILFGKPRDQDDAREMLRSLSGRWHRVITGYAIVDCMSRAQVTRVVTTQVEFRTLVDGEISAYIDTREPFDKAGGYAIQGRAALFVTDVKGDFFNVVGLPIGPLARDLRDFNILPEWSWGGRGR